MSTYVHMMKRIIASICLASTLLAGCSDDETVFGPPPESSVMYRVTFTSTWSAQTHPDEFPANPHFSSLVGATHCGCVKFWEVGELSSAGTKDMAELGATSTLAAEIEEARIDSTEETLLLGGGIPHSPGSVSLDFEISLYYPQVTLVSMLAPSPDWFVGVSGLPLFDGSDWVDSLEVPLYPYDAGTDDGTTYTSPNAVTQPPVGIFAIHSGPLWADDSLPSVGTFTFVRQ